MKEKSTENKNFAIIGVAGYIAVRHPISEGGGKLSKRERPKALRRAIKTRPDLYLDKLAEVGGIDTQQLKEFIAGDRGHRRSNGVGIEYGPMVGATVGRTRPYEIPGPGGRKPPHQCHRFF